MRCKWSLWLFVFLGLAFTASYSFTAPPLQNSKNKKGNSDGDQSEYYKKWLNEDAAYIISEEEKSVFKNLNTDEERENFIEQFWARRNPDPRSPDNSFKAEHYRRIAYANERFASGIPGWKTDRGRIYIMYGKPDETDSHPSGGTYNREIWEGGGTTTTYPFEKWRYRHIDGLGDDVEIEFVDPSLTGEYRIALSPDEKDALLYVPNSGKTLAEQQGLVDRSQRTTFSPSAYNDPNLSMGMRAKDLPFARMEQYFNLQRPPEIKFADLKSVVTTHITYNSLPYTIRTDFIRLSSDRVLVPITLEISNRNLEFKRELEFNRASVNVYGLVKNLTGRIMYEFEDVIAAEYTDEYFEQGKNLRSEYQKIVGLPPGQRYMLDLVLKDVNSKSMGSMSLGINVPKYDDDNLQSSTIILANSVSQAPISANQLQQYVIGDLKILPNVKSEYLSGQNLIPYMQVYNAAIDQASLKPSLEVTFSLKRDGKVLEERKDLSGNSIQFFSEQRVVIIGQIPLKSIAPGEYRLEVMVQDNISNRKLINSTDFKVSEPVKTNSAATR